MLRDLELYYSPFTGLSHPKEGACTPIVIHFNQYVSPQRLPNWCCIIWVETLPRFDWLFAPGS
jgi:hypothetical protein